MKKDYELLARLVLLLGILEYFTIIKIEQFSKVYSIYLEENNQKPIECYYQTILTFFDNRNTNASAEFFNAKIKAFRSFFRGVRNISFFLFRLSKNLCITPTFCLDP